MIFGIRAARAAISLPITRTGFCTINDVLTAQ